MNMTGWAKKMMGWCSQVNMSTQKNYEATPESFQYEQRSFIPPDLPFVLRNSYVLGITREALIGISLMSLFCILAIGEGIHHFFDEYVIELILFTAIISQYVLLRTTISITDRKITTHTFLQPIVGSSDHLLSSIRRIQVKREVWKARLSVVLILLGILNLYLFLSDLFAGEPFQELIHFLFLIFFIFNLGFISYFTSIFSIKIEFLPNPSINYIQIYTGEAQHIADVLEWIDRHEGNTGGSNELYQIH